MAYQSNHSLGGSSAGSRAGSSPPMAGKSQPPVPVNSCVSSVGQASNPRISRISRPPLERASSVPERGTRRNNNTPSSGTTTACYSGSKTSIDKGASTDKGSKEAIISGAKAAQERNSADSLQQQAQQPLLHRDHPPKYATIYTGSRDSLERFTSSIRQSLDQGINSSASVDRPINLIQTADGRHASIEHILTPPTSPTTSKGGAAMFANNVKGFPKRKLPSLKIKGGSRTAAIHSDSKDSTTSSPTNAVVQHPTITITMNDDTDSAVSDNLGADKNCKKAEAQPQVQFPVPNIGDDVSLYGTPKEELSPLKEVDYVRSSTSATNYLKDQIISFFQPSDNKLAMKLFGNKNALMKEKMRQKAAGNWVIHPCSNFR